MQPRGLRVPAGGQAGGNGPPDVGEGGLTGGLAVSLLQEAEAIVQKIKQQQYADLLSHDQLLTERKEQKVFLHFGKNCGPLLLGPLQPLLPLFPEYPRGGGEGLCLQNKEPWAL